MSQSLKEAAAYSQRWLEIIKKSSLTESEGKQVIEESLINFTEHFNKNWLEYRKSVTEAGDWASVEWSGSGAIFKDVLGRDDVDRESIFYRIRTASAAKDFAAVSSLQLEMARKMKELTALYRLYKQNLEPI